MSTDSASHDTSADEAAIRALYRSLHDAWNERDAHAFAALFTYDGEAVGYDGSEMFGQEEIASTLGQIFSHHQTAAYVAVVRAVRFLSPDIAYLRAVAGLVPPGQNDIASQLNALQTLVATKRDGAWRIACFQNTPLQYHGRPELTEQVSADLRQALRARGDNA